MANSQSSNELPSRLLKDVQMLQARAQNIVKIFSELVDQIGSNDPKVAAMAAGKLYEFTNDFDGAIAYYEAARESRSCDAEVLARLSAVHVKRGNFGEGLRYAEMLIDGFSHARIESLGGRSMSAFTIVGNALQAAGRDPREAYEAALTAYPGDGAAAGYLAQLRLESGDIEGAAKLRDHIDLSVHSRFEGLESALRLAERGGDAPTIMAAKLSTVIQRPIQV